jgi:HEAT repeat protein
VGLQAIQDALEDENPFVRAEALDLLMSQGPGAEIVGRLGSLAQHKDPTVRATATMALGEQTGAEAEFLLKRGLNDENDSVKELATHLLKQKEARGKQKP